MSGQKLNFHTFIKKLKSSNFTNFWEKNTTIILVWQFLYKINIYINA